MHYTHTTCATVTCGRGGPLRVARMESTRGDVGSSAGWGSSGPHAGAGTEVCPPGCASGMGGGVLGGAVNLTLLFWTSSAISKCLRFGTPQEARTRCQECGLLPRGLGEPASFIQAPFSARSSLGLKQRNFHLSPLGDCTEGKWTPFGQGGTVPHPENLVSACVITQKCLLKPSCDPLKIKFPVSHPGSP